jgi:Tfp pilus assembly protein PilW
MRILPKSLQTKARQLGMSLPETMLCTGLGGLLLTILMALSMFGAHSFAAMTNYVDLDQHSRNALDRITSDIRQADRLTAFATNSLSFQTRDPNTGATNVLQYTYDANAQTLTRSLNGESSVFLLGCTALQFSIFQRNPVNGSYDQYPVDDPGRPDLCKLVQVNWACSRKILGQAINSESVQSAKVVMRRP